MSKRLGLAAALAASVIGCATQEGYRAVLDSYLGSSEASVIAHWGPPDRAYSSDADTRYLTYSRSESGYIAGTPPSFQTTCSFGSCTSIPVGGSPGFSYTNACATYFKLVRGRVQSWGFRGNACRA